MHRVPLFEPEGEDIVAGPAASPCSAVRRSQWTAFGGRPRSLRATKRPRSRRSAAVPPRRPCWPGFARMSCASACRYRHHHRRHMSGALLAGRLEALRRRWRGLAGTSAVGKRRPEASMKRMNASSSAHGIEASEHTGERVVARHLVFEFEDGTRSSFLALSEPAPSRHKNSARTASLPARRATSRASHAEHRYRADPAQWTDMTKKSLIQCPPRTMRTPDRIDVQPKRK